MKIGRITLSFIFISLGVMLLLEKISNYRIINTISVFWPAVIVFLGIEIIYSNLYMKKDKEIKRTVDIISVIIIFILVLILGLGDISKIDRQYTYSDDISEELILDDIEKIIINDSNIDIIISRSEDGNSKIRLEGVYKYNKREDRKEQKEYIRQDNKGRVAKISRDKDINRNFNKVRKRDMRYLIEIPNGIEVELISNYGDIDIENIKNKISIISSYGDIKLEDIEGNINIENSYGDFKAENINGSIFVKSNNGDISIESSNIKEKSVDVYCDFGDVKLALPKGQIGKFNMITTYGDIHDELKFDIIESVSTKSINQIRKTLRPNFNIRVNNGDIILKED